MQLEIGMADAYSVGVKDITIRNQETGETAIVRVIEIEAIRPQWRRSPGQTIVDVRPDTFAHLVELTAENK